MRLKASSVSPPCSPKSGSANKSNKPGKPFPSKRTETAKTVVTKQRSGSAPGRLSGQPQLNKHAGSSPPSKPIITRRRSASDPDRPSSRSSKQIKPPERPSLRQSKSRSPSPSKTKEDTPCKTGQGNQRKGDKINSLPEVREGKTKRRKSPSPPIKMAVTETKKGVVHAVFSRSKADLRSIRAMGRIKVPTRRHKHNNRTVETRKLNTKMVETSPKLSAAGVKRLKSKHTKVVSGIPNPTAPKVTRPSRLSSNVLSTSKYTECPALQRMMLKMVTQGYKTKFNPLRARAPTNSAGEALRAMQKLQQTADSRFSLPSNDSKFLLMKARKSLRTYESFQRRMRARKEGRRSAG